MSAFVSPHHLQEVNVEFEAYSISDKDYDGIKKLLQQVWSLPLCTNLFEENPGTQARSDSILYFTIPILIPSTLQRRKDSFSFLLRLTPWLSLQFIC